MDDSAIREMEKLRDECIAMCEQARQLAQTVIAVIDRETPQAAGHRKQRQARPSYLTIVKGLISGAAGYALVRKLAAAGGAAAVTVAAVTVAAPLVLRSPRLVPAVRAPAVTRSAAPHQMHRSRTVSAHRRRAAPAPVLMGAGHTPAPSPAPVVQVSVTPAPSVSVSPPACLISLLGLCVP